MTMTKRIKSILILVMIPIFIGSIIYLITQNTNIFEIILIVFGASELIVYVRKGARTERHNMKSRGTYKADKKSVEYFIYKDSQKTLLIAAIITLALSYLAFLILGV